MPLTQKVTFKAAFQKGNRILIPKLIRWQFKIETQQVLKIGIKILGTGGGWQFFYAKMTRDGQLNISKMTLALLQGEKETPQG